MSCAGMTEHDILKYSIPKHCIVSQNLTFHGTQTVPSYWDPSILNGCYLQGECTIESTPICLKLYGDK